MRQVDLAIVGAGPTGLFAAYYAGFRGLSTAVIDALPEPGGQVTAMYPEKALMRDWERLPLDKAIQAGIRACVEARRTDEPRRLMTAFLNRKRGKAAG